MENTDINTSNIENVDIDRILKEAIKEKIEKLMETELNAYLEENPGIKNGKYKRDLKTKYGEIKQLNIPSSETRMPVNSYASSSFSVLTSNLASISGHSLVKW